MGKTQNKTIELKDYLQRFQNSKESEQNNDSPIPKFKPIRFKKEQSPDGGIRFFFDMENMEGLAELVQKLAETTGIASRPFGLTLINQVLAAIAKDTDTIPDTRNAATAALLDASPEDGLEGMLLSQMIAVHHHAMVCLGKANVEGQHSENIDRNQNQAIRLMRTFASQLETLEKYRRKGKTTIVVERKG